MVQTPIIGLERVVGSEMAQQQMAMLLPPDTKVDLPGSLVTACSPTPVPTPLHTPGREEDLTLLVSDPSDRPYAMSVQVREVKGVFLSPDQVQIPLESEVSVAVHQLDRLGRVFYRGQPLQADYPAESIQIDQSLLLTRQVLRVKGLQSGDFLIKVSLLGSP